MNKILCVGLPPRAPYVPMSGESFEELVKRRTTEFQTAKDEDERRRRDAQIKRQSAKKRDFNDIERKAAAQIRELDKRSHDPKEGRSRRNTGSCYDPMERHARILRVLKDLGKHFARDYSFPSQAKMLDLLNRYHGLSMSRRTLNTDLASMEARGLIARTRRLSWGKFTSTIYHITKNGRKWWSAAQKMFGLFKSSRVQSSANNNDLSTKDKVLYGEILKIPPDRQPLSSDFVAVT